jgi:hypothetical protein
MVVTYQARQDTAERNNVTQSEASTKEPRDHPKHLTGTDHHALIRAVTTITTTQCNAEEERYAGPSWHVAPSV